MPLRRRSGRYDLTRAYQAAARKTAKESAIADIKFLILSPAVAPSGIFPSSTMTHVREGEP